MAKMLVLKLLQLDTSEFSGRCYFLRLLLLQLGTEQYQPVFLVGFWLRAFWLGERLPMAPWIRKAGSARTVLGHHLIRFQVVLGLTSTWVDSTQKLYHPQTLFPMSQFLEIRSTSDSDGDGCLSFIAPLDFGEDSEGTE